MSYHAAIQIDWFGPFDDELQAKEFAETDSRGLNEGLYVKIGNTARQRGAARLQYVGISERDLTYRINDPKHRKLRGITQSVQFWLGEIGSFGLPREAKFKGNRAIRLAEWLHASYVKKASSRTAFALNEQSTKGVTRDPATVINHWWDVRASKEEPFEGLLRTPHEWWPYIIDYYGSGYNYNGEKFKPEARLTWLDGSWDLVRLSK